jgi:TonB family protein
VTVGLRVDVDGVVRATWVAASSGDPDLDAAAASRARLWRFAPLDAPRVEYLPFHFHLR